MNTALIMLGSNSNADHNLELSKEKLSEYFELVSQSSRLFTKPFGKHYTADFQNEAIKILSSETADETRIIFKQIEMEMGRTPESKKLGLIPIDIDLIFWNEKLLHEDYNRFDFVKTCVDEIKG
jgi:2-amino-4-hydroxy-6-hydroxymethyldihydropteridine diphosphokinase